MKPGVLFAGWALACAASLSTAPALAQHSASGHITATPAATAAIPVASNKPDASADAQARANTTSNNKDQPAAPAASSAMATAATAPASAAAPDMPPAALTAAPSAAPAIGATAGPAAGPALDPTSAAHAALPAPTASNGPSAAGSLLQTTLALAFVLALLVGAAWFLKRYGPKSITGGTAVKLVGALNVGARERILVVEIGEQWIVVGASPGRMNALATMPRQEAEAAALAAQPGLPGANFAEWFKQTIEKRHGK